MSKLAIVLLGATLLGPQPAIAGNTMADSGWQVYPAVRAGGTGQASELVATMSAEAPAWGLDFKAFATDRPTALAGGDKDPADAGDVLQTMIYRPSVSGKDGAGAYDHGWQQTDKSGSVCWTHCSGKDTSVDPVEPYHLAITDPADAGKILRFVEVAKAGGENDPADAGGVLLSFDYRKPALQYASFDKVIYSVIRD